MTDPVDTREITLTRVFAAPRETVFAMWTEAEHLARWWGPDGFTAPRVVSDPRPGGELTIDMVGQGLEQTMRARYLEVSPPDRLVVESVAPDPDGSPVIASRHTVTFTDLGGRTEVTVLARASVFRPEGRAALEGMRAGWSQSLQRLDDVLTGADQRQLVLMRIYEAPPEQVFPLWVTGEHLKRWWGPTGFSITIDEIDPRPGGIWRFTMHGPEGTEHPNLVTYREVVPGERLVYLHENPAGSDPSFLGVVTFEEMAGRTVLSMRLVFDTPAERDLVVTRYDAETGASQTLDRLAELVRSVVSTASAGG